MLSVIITAFDENDCKIVECVSSLYRFSGCKQIILVNDNPLRTLSKIKFEKHVNIKLYEDKTNRGVSGARNLGLQLATEKYVMFVDADDKVYAIDQNEFDLKSIKEEVDVIYFNYVISDEKTDISVNLTSDKEKLNS